MTWDRQRKIRTGSIAFSLLLIIGFAWFVATKGWFAEWITYTYPRHGSVNIPLLDTITIQWKEGEGEYVSFRVEYEDDPTVPILGVTSGSKDGMSFMPEGFLPNKKVKVSVASGWRTHSFVFTTAKEADRKVDAYHSVLTQFLKFSLQGQPPELVALDVSTIKGWPRREQGELVNSLLSVHPNSVYGTVKEGFQPVNEKHGIDPDLDQDALLIRIDQQEDRFGTYELAVRSNRGIGVLQGAKGSEAILFYSSTYQDGKWQVKALKEVE